MGRNEARHRAAARPSFVAQTLPGSHPRVHDVDRPDDNPIDVDAGGGARPFVPSDNTTLTSVLEGLDHDGYSAQFLTEPGARLRCSECDTTSPASAFDVHAIRRLEGASEPDEMMSVVAATCPSCGRGGTAVLGYGPNASPDEADVSLALRRDR
jgi:hypothetical protein